MDENGCPHYYKLNKEEYYSNELKDNLEDTTVIEDIQDEDIGEIIEKREDVITSIKRGFSATGMKADIDDESGKITLDSSFLFGFDSTELSDDGKQYLDEFVDVYAGIIVEQAQKENVSKIVVVGHTDTQGEYDYNQKLSEQRAEAVKEYCLEQHSELESYFESEGRSYDEPILKDDGSVDMEASRRVEFKCILNIE